MSRCSYRSSPPSPFCSSRCPLPPRDAPPAQPPASAEAAPPPVTLPPALDRVLRDYEAAWRDGDGARLAALFTEDGFAVQSGSPLARGREAIAKNIKGPGGALQLAAYAYSVSDTVGYIVGGYRYPQSTGPGGRFVLALRMGTDGRWLIAADTRQQRTPTLAAILTPFTPMIIHELGPAECDEVLARITIGRLGCA